MAYDDLDPDQQDELKTAATEFQDAVKSGSPEDVVRTFESLEQLCDEYGDDSKPDDKPGMTVVIGAKPKPKGMMEGM